MTKAAGRAEVTARRARQGGDYPLLSRGDINLYALFVERSMALLGPDGVLGLLTPSGIASDKNAAAFFKGVATTGRLKALYDFENRRTRYELPPFFPDVDTRFKFCAFVAGRERRFDVALCAFFVQSVQELADPERCFPLSAADFARLNPNTGTAPILRRRRDAELITRIYGGAPIVVDRSGKTVRATWPFQYLRQYDMTNDSGLFRTEAGLLNDEGAWRIEGGRWESAAGRWAPLYEGKMVQAFDHRAADIVANLRNQHRPGQPQPATDVARADPAWLPTPQFWVADEKAREGLAPPRIDWRIAFKDVTSPTNMRTMIAAIAPGAAFGNTLPFLAPAFPEPPEEEDTDAVARWTEECAQVAAAYCALAPLVVANLNALALDFCARQKVQGQHLNWFIVEQLPVIAPARFGEVRFGDQTAGDIVRAAALELSYTAHDMAPFARDLGHVDAAGNVLPPFPWNPARRLRLRAKLDAVFFHLYGVFDAADRAQSRDDIAYIYSTFPIVERQEQAAHGRYLSRDLCLTYCNTLAAGRPDAEPEL